MVAIVTIYALGLALSILYGSMPMAVGGTPADRRLGARIVLTSPLWPLQLLYGVARFVRTLLRDAQWGRWAR